MADHDYDVKVAGVDVELTLGIRRAIITNYSSANRRNGNLIIPHRHGELHVPDKYFEGADVLLQAHLPFDTVDAGKQALSDLARLFSSQTEVVVEQNDPAHGDIRARVELLQDPVPTEDRFTYLYSLRNASGFWEDVTATSVGPAMPPAVVTGGDRPIQDMILTFAGPGFLEHTDDLGQVARVEIEAAAGAGTYVVDVGAGTVEKAGVPQDEFLVITQPWVMKWQPNDTPALTADVNVTAQFRNKYA